MSVILIMIPAALLLAGIGIAAFIYAARTGQFDDLDTPALRAVFDDDEHTEDRNPEVNTPSKNQATNDH
ncbi:MAG: cbb3-type cytochrome oxidase assembly protein CcoS [Phycisphaerales bacterium]